MDIQRPHVTRRRIIRRVVVSVIVIGTVSAIAMVTSRLKPAAPLVEAGTVWPDTVKRGEMVLQVRGLGTLVPQEIVYVPAPFPGRVLKIDEEAGTTVTAGTVIVELKNPDMEQQVLDAEWNLATAESDLANFKAQIHSTQVNQRADLATLQAQHRDLKAKNDRDEVLYKQGLMLELDYRLSKTSVEDMAARIGFEGERQKAMGEQLEAQFTNKQNAIRQLQAIRQLRRDQVAALKVTAGVSGVLQQVPVQQGQQLGSGANLAIIVQPRRLKAALAVAEAQAKDVLVGQHAEIDTQNGVIPGSVSRIDPTVVNGTRTVDVRLEGPLPPGAVPDKSVDGMILIERLEDVVHMARPIAAQAGGDISLFKITPDGTEAYRVKVRLGRTTVNAVEIKEGLRVGDRVILSDMTAVDGYDRIRLK